MTKIENLFWDTCVITAYLKDETESDIPSIEQFLHDAKAGICKIYTSTISIAEILPSHLVGKKYPSYLKFLKDFEGSIIPVAPDPNIMALASRIRDIPYSKKANDKSIAYRKMDVPDAIMLATALILAEGFRVKVDKFHTFDDGGKRSLDRGRCVPLLSFEGWCEMLDAKHGALAQQVIDLPRCRPIHSNPALPGV